MQLEALKEILTLAQSDDGTKKDPHLKYISENNCGATALGIWRLMACFYPIANDGSKEDGSDQMLDYMQVKVNLEFHGKEKGDWTALWWSHGLLSVIAPRSALPMSSPNI